MKYLLEKNWKRWNWKWSLEIRKKATSLKGKGKKWAFWASQVPKICTNTQQGCNTVPARCLWGCNDPRETQRKRVPAAQHLLRSLADAREPQWVDNIVSGGNVSFSWCSVCALKPQDLLAHYFSSDSVAANANLILRNAWSFWTIPNYPWRWSHE